MHVFALLVLSAFCLVGCENGPSISTDGRSTSKTAPSSPLQTFSRPLMGTLFRIQVDGGPSNTEHVVRNAFEEIERLESVLSEWRKGSEISEINRLAGRRGVTVGDDVRRVVLAGLDVSRWSRGAFDLSWAALWGLYDFRAENPKIPTAKTIRPRLALIDWRKIEVDERRQTVRLRKRGMAIGTGGIAKGYALDRAGAILRSRGIENYMIFGGGQVQVHGQRDGRAWRVGIQHPRDPSTYIGSLESTGGSFSTSGDYEHAFFDKKGNRWHHIIDTRTGRPASKSLSVTVLSSEGIYSDALSTGAFVMGPRRALEMFDRLSVPAEAVIIGSDCKLYATPGARKQLRLNVELEDGNRVPNCKP